MDGRGNDAVESDSTLVLDLGVDDTWVPVRMGHHSEGRWRDTRSLEMSPALVTCRDVERFPDSIHKSTQPTRDPCTMPSTGNQWV